MQWVWEELQRLRNYGGPNSKVCRTTRGQYTIAQRGGKSTVQSEGVAVMMVVKTLSGSDYYAAQQFDGTSTYGDTVFVAKPPPLRPSVSAETVDGVSLTYSYDSVIPTKDNERTASDGTNTELQVVFPRYIQLGSVAHYHQSVIFAIQSDHTGVIKSGSELEWIEIGPSRVWCRRYIQPS